MKVESLCKCSSSNANTQNHDELHKIKIAIIAIDEYAILRFLCRCMYNSCISFFKWNKKYLSKPISQGPAVTPMHFFFFLFFSFFFFFWGGGLCWQEFINPVQLRMECEHNIYITSKHVMCSTGCKCTCFSSPMSIAPIKLKYPEVHTSIDVKHSHLSHSPNVSEVFPHSCTPICKVVLLVWAVAHKTIYTSLLVNQETRKNCLSTVYSKCATQTSINYFCTHCLFWV